MIRKIRFAVGDKVHVFYGVLPSKIARRLYGDSIIIKSVTESTKAKNGKSGKRSRKKKLRVGQEPYLATGVIREVTQFKRYRVTLDSGEEIKQSIRSNCLKPAVIRKLACQAKPPTKISIEEKIATPASNKNDPPPDLVSDSASIVSDSDSLSAKCSSSYTTDTEFTSDSTSGTERTVDYSNVSESESDLASQLQSTYSTRNSTNIPTKKGSLSAQYKAIALEAKDQILPDSARSRSKKLKL